MEIIETFIEPAVYGITALAFLTAAVGIYEIIGTIRASKQYERAIAARDAAQKALQEAIKKHTRRRELRADLTRATHEMLRAEGRLR